MNKNSDDIGVLILQALDDGNIELVDELFNTHSNIVDPSRITESAKWNWLHSIYMGFDPDKPPKEAALYFINKGVPVNAQDCYKMTPLHYAVRSNNIEGVKVLLEAGADPNIPNQDGITAFHQHFVENCLGDYKMVKLLLSYGANPLKSIKIITSTYENMIAFYENILRVGIIDDNERIHIYKMIDLIKEYS